MYCQKCGSSNADVARFCETCGSALALAEPQPPPVPPAQQHAGHLIPQPVGPYHDPHGVSAGHPPWPPPTHQDWRVRGGNQRERNYVRKDPAVAVLLSVVVPGLGQFYNGDSKKGVVMLGAFCVSALFAALLIGIPGVIGVWIWSVLDSHNVASGKARTW